MTWKRTMLRILEPIVAPLTTFFVKRHYQDIRTTTKLDENQRVLVFAPHVDDETIGLGGTLLRYAQKNAHTTVVYMTDGAKSVGAHDTSHLVKTRKQEAKRAQQLLGIQDIQFLDAPDGKIAEDDTLPQQMREIIEKISPDVIYCTTYVDCHPDHVATARHLASALESIDLDMRIRLYEINTPLPHNAINCIVDISNQQGKKAQATDIFASQSIDFDGFLRLGELKASLVNESDVYAVETFRDLPKAMFCHEVEVASGRNEQFNQLFKQVNKASTLMWAIFQGYNKKEAIFQETMTTPVRGNDS